MASCRVLAVLAALALVGPPRPAHAQTARGVVLLPDSATPATGVVVEAMMLDAPTVRARALTGRDGAYTLRLPRAGRFQLRGLRIGFRPTVFGTFVVALGGSVEGRHVLEAVSLTLPRVIVDANRQCNVTDDSGALVGALLGQARVALAATLLESPDGRVTSVARRFRQIESLDGQVLAVMLDTLMTGATDRPFASVDPRVIAREGFVRDDGTFLEFRAPDAATLLSEQFVAEYCFALAPTRRSPHPEWIGIAVTPARRRPGIVPIAGTLWLDRATTELRRFDFQYLELRPELATAGGGGSVDFHRLPTGVWIMPRWVLRLPRATAVHEDMGARSPGTQVQRVSVGTVARTGGEVSSVRLGETVLYESATPVVTAPTGVRAPQSPGPSCAHEPPASRFENGTVFGIIVDSTGALTQQATVHVDWFAGAQARPNPAASLRRYKSAPVLDGFFLFCGVGVGREVRLRADDGDLESGVTNIRLKADQPSSSLTVRLRTPMKAADPVTTTGRP